MWSFSEIREEYMKLEIDEDGVGTIKLDGALTIQRSTELKEALAGALQQVDRLVLDMEQVSEFDLSCMQLLCSAHRSFLGRKKCLKVLLRSPEEFGSTMKRLGYSRNVCGVLADQDCLWNGGAC